MRKRARGGLMNYTVHFAEFPAKQRSHQQRIVDILLLLFQFVDFRVNRFELAHHLPHRILHVNAEHVVVLDHTRAHVRRAPHEIRSLRTNCTAIRRKEGGDLPRHVHEIVPKVVAGKLNRKQMSSHLNNHLTQNIMQREIENKRTILVILHV